MQERRGEDWSNFNRPEVGFDVKVVLGDEGEFNVGE